MTPFVPPSKANLPQEAENSPLQAVHWKALVEASKSLNSTLDLDRLLELILEVATKALRADRGTVFLLYPETGDLRARISQGMESRVLRVEVGQGLAGKVAETGETIRIENAYQDSRFHHDLDAAHGYRTKSVLCMAIRNRTGAIVGVIQLLNKLDGTFDSADEIFLEALTVHVAIALENARLHAQEVDRERIRTELEMARQIQGNLLRPPPERWHGYRIAAKSDPCYEVGGDLYDFLAISQGAMWVVIADVSGKGISAALVMSTLQATLRALLVGVHSFERMLERLNAMIRDFTGGSKYVTLFLALLDSGSRKVQYINAGHNPPILVHTDGSFELLEEGGTVLGLLPDVRFTRAQTVLQPGDVLALYTDGLVEASNSAGDMFGIEGLVRSVQAASSDRDPATVLARILSDAREFSAGAPQADDQTIAIIRPES